LPAAEGPQKLMPQDDEVQQPHEEKADAPPSTPSLSGRASSDTRESASTTDASEVSEMGTEQPLVTVLPGSKGDATADVRELPQHPSPTGEHQILLLGGRDGEPQTGT
jgi:hypothetical protein